MSNLRILWLIFIIMSFTHSCKTGTDAESSNQTVLIIQDEMPQMTILADYLRANSDVQVDIVDQMNLPADLSSYRAVIGFIHYKLDEKTELAIIEYTQAGGRYICLHHSISSGKAKNRFYFHFLGIQLDNPSQSKKPVQPGGGYAWRHGDFTLVNLNPNHYITRHKVTWSDSVDYTPSDSPSVPAPYPAIELTDSEAYMNHKFTDGREKQVLCGMKYFDDRNGELFMQDRALWIKKSGNGEIIYFLPGHSAADFQNRNISQIALNAIEWDGLD